MNTVFSYSFLHYLAAELCPLQDKQDKYLLIEKWPQII